MSKWWQERVVYQIYPRSFQDSNGDGIGDINGIISRLGCLKDLGVGIIWLSPVYPSPNADNGYDISDYMNIHPEYGTMKDMDRLLAEAAKCDIKIVMDLVINHTSDEHEWFEKSRQKIEPYKDYYIWKPDKKGKRPNNWTSFFAEPCWTYDEVRKEYYLHLFAKKQPDLNYHNPKVLEEVKAIMRFWLDKGVAGFRCDVINIIYKTSLEDGKKKLILTGSEHYLSQEGNHKILQELRQEVLDHYDCFTVGETVFVTPEIGKKLCDQDRRELDMIFSFEHMEADQWLVKYFHRKFNVKKFSQSIAKWQVALDWHANYLENHDQRRIVSRFSDEYYREASGKLFAVLLLSLKGTPYIYQGQEIGMTNFDYTSIDEVRDIESINVDAFLKKHHVPKFLRWKMIKETSRDNCRTPMQWSSNEHGDFTTGVPWLAVNKNHIHINVKSQLDDPQSIRSFYKKMIALRAKHDVLKYGEFEALEITHKLFVFKRTYEDTTFTVVLNISNKSLKTEYNGKVKISTRYRKQFDGLLEPYEAIILEGGKHDQ
ncbi:MAG: alpha-glucosidase [Clostridiales bacterium]|nr:alpha-glucosidase [Clostridiales bacterium]